MTGEAVLRTDVRTWPDVQALPEPVRSLVVQQEGTATTAQLVAGGVPARTVARRVRCGRWQRLHRGVVVLQSGPVRWRQRAHGALLAAGPGSALSHASAAYLHGFRATPGRSVVVSVPAERVVRPHAGLVVRRRRRVPPAWGGCGPWAPRTRCSTSCTRPPTRTRRWP
ncbi:type IV toxin-antitoxin system AbiEi family antitoxin domain-containing protein [Cellulomonas sp. JZ18]|uniref:type IV toxin-antitoxin system AbiEi family antitoxin domain-containing protein n=1 Tax=Cellulomonas sp. JZ18 TaxID=2654191 RepID=UPI0018AFC43E|nr:type IV toxin-antitoxin system AbiEi family antitoxin domain-containing protein [Cellulomonas sp. JZ18]